ncbi:primosomal protein N' (replication factor Y) - superfamily II helicase [Tabrizicola sp. KVB23]|uniref:Primosomal protein N' (Replication factor Y) -superfamily II helicase n=1 Tax=Fuscibacter oryzae TaxID=2803939 RepID=A0A8J7MM80_9RHOB|nr:primosomal protein N' (replication factor Y) - superfamily II helicase [Fuscibacter oryzae]MBL4926727.1 primosomal protein N' (replication factor Y) - superfamily II helicase [Fuscibacter oryzae]
MVPKVTQEHRWPCSACGAELRFAPGQTQLVCDHCGHVETIPAADAPRRARALGELDLAQGLRDDLPDEATAEVRTTRCPNCGSVVEFQGASHATECPFCATPVVIDTGSQRRLKPQAVVPFQLTEAQARDRLTGWLGGLWFAPNRLLEFTRKGRAMAGIYVPYWTFDADSASRYSGERGDYYYTTEWVTVEVNGRTERRQQQVRHTRWTSVSGRVARAFDDVLILASTSIPPHLGNALSNWDLSALAPYSPDYLAGFQAEGYTVPLSDGHSRARDWMGRVIAEDVRRDIGGDEQRITDIDSTFRAETFKHILLPIWMAAYKYNGRSYQFLVNGQTGEVRGERPYSIWKITLAILAVAAIVGVAFYLNDQGMLNR